MSISAMTIVSVALGSLATLGLGAAVLRLLGLTRVPVTLLLGAGYGLGAVIVGISVPWVSAIGLTLGATSWVVVLAGLVTGAWVLRHLHVTRYVGNGARALGQSGISSNDPKHWYQDKLTIALLALIGVHLVITFGNNLTRPIFPWDAFTTWMYRAKAWVLEDAVSTMANTSDWIAAGGQEGYAIYASHYPTALSVYAAFMSALTGEWQPAAASAPWTLCFLALCSALHGALRMANLSNRLTIIGAYLLASLPLLNIHAALSGYGDLWMAFFAGGGLALLLLGRLVASAQAIWLGTLLLLVGTQIKSEGWLWLGMGLTFLAMDTLVRRVGYFRFCAGVSAVSAFVWFMGWTYLALGPLGKWGLDAERLHAGFLGSFALRPYQPATNYFEILFEQPNFLLLGSAYLFAMLVAALTRIKDSTSLWLMGVMIAISQGVIFGLSSYSRYAETGTAITRLLLQFTPVMVVTIIMVWQMMRLKYESRPDSSPLTTIPSSWNVSTTAKRGIFLLLTTIALAAPGLVLLNTMEPATNSNVISFKQSDFSAVVGRSNISEQGQQFIDSPINVGVLKVKRKLPTRPLPRYLVTDISMAELGDAAFYWVLQGDTAVQSVSLGLSGRAIEDLSQYPLWRDQTVQELGYLVQSHSFETTRVRGLALQHDIGLKDFGALMNHWSVAEPFNHRLINNTLGHIEAPVSTSAWFNIALVALMLLTIFLLLSGATKSLSYCTGPALLALWILFDLLSVRASEVYEGAFGAGRVHYPTFIEQTERRINRAIEAVNVNSHRNLPVLTVAIDERAQLAAQSSPFQFLPRAAAFTHKRNAKAVAADWPGSVIVFGSTTEGIVKAAKAIASANSRSTVSTHDGFTVISMEAK